MAFRFFNTVVRSPPFSNFESCHLGSASEPHGLEVLSLAREISHHARTVVLGYNVPGQTHGVPGRKHGVLGLCVARPVLLKPSRWSPQGDSSWAGDRVDGSLRSDIQAGGCDLSWKQIRLP